MKAKDTSENLSGPNGGSEDVKISAKIDDLVDVSSANYPQSFKCALRARLPTEFRGTFNVLFYENINTREYHLALVYGNRFFSKSLDLEDESQLSYNSKVHGAWLRKNIQSSAEGADTKPVLIRIHSSCFTGETLSSVRCDCHEQLEESKRLVSEEGCGIIIYLMQEGRGIGLKEKLLAYNLIDMGHDTVSANVALHHKPDDRDYSPALDILNDLGISSVRLLTNNPDKVKFLQDMGIKVERIPMIPHTWKKLTEREKRKQLQAQRELSDSSELSQSSICVTEIDSYLVSKIKKMGHMMQVPKSILEKVVVIPTINSNNDKRK